MFLTEFLQDESVEVAETETRLFVKKDGVVFYTKKHPYAYTWSPIKPNEFPTGLEVEPVIEAEILAPENKNKVKKFQSEADNYYCGFQYLEYIKFPAFGTFRSKGYECLVRLWDDNQFFAQCWKPGNARDTTRSAIGKTATEALLRLLDACQNIEGFKS